MQSIGKFRLDGELGRGAMGIVFRGFDPAIGRPVAVKVILASEFATLDEKADMQARFRREAAAAGRLSHPNIVTVHQFAEDDGVQYLVLELVDSCSLDKILVDNVLQDTRTALSILFQVARALDYAHGEGVVHRDIKPANILVRPDGHVKITDFGIARMSAHTVTKPGFAIGTLAFMAPEQIRAEQVSGKSDQFSLAVVAYLMLCGRMPFVGENQAALLWSILSEEPSPVHHVNPAIRPAASEVIARALSKDPGRRYATCAEMVEFLSDSLREPQPQALAIPSAEVAEAAAAQPVQEITAPVMDRVPDLLTTRAERFPSAPESRPVFWQSPKSGDAVRDRAARLVTILTRARRGWAARVVIVLALSGALYEMFSGYFLYQNGLDLASEVQTERLTDLDRIWAKWTELSSGNRTSFFLYEPRTVVKQKFVAAVDHVIDTYRNNESQLIYEKEWEQARSNAARALAVDAEDSVRGKLRVCEGHLARINGTSHRSAQELNQAVEKFDEAQKLLPKSPDPELGLARVYVYGLKDIDKGYEALQQAQKRGYTLGNREKFLLADGYRDRADRLWWDSRNVRGLPPEKDHIQKAADDYKRAEELYQAISPLGNSIANLARVRLSLESVKFRLHQIESGTDPK